MGHKMFRIVSDLHLEGMSEYFLSTMDGEDDMILILAGDICEFHLIETYKCYQNFLEDCSNRFREIIYVPGNHEYYNDDWNNSFGKWKNVIEKKYKNITVMDREVMNVPIDVQGKTISYKVVGTTLWTDMNNNNPITKMTGARFLNDFKMIKGGFTPETMVEENEKSRTFIRYALIDAMENFDPVIVVTHHGPTVKSIAPKYQHNDFHENCLFVNTVIDSYFEEFPLRLWVHGHTHESINHLAGHGCKVIANPKGYSQYSFIKYGEHVIRHQNSNYDDRLVLTAEALYF